jgi:hypothetical protein
MHQRQIPISLSDQPRRLLLSILVAYQALTTIQIMTLLHNKSPLNPLIPSNALAENQTPPSLPNIALLDVRMLHNLHRDPMLHCQVLQCWTFAKKLTFLSRLVRPAEYSYCINSRRKIMPPASKFCLSLWDWISPLVGKASNLLGRLLSPPRKSGPNKIEKNERTERDIHKLLWCLLSPDSYGNVIPHQHMKNPLHILSMRPDRNVGRNSPRSSRSESVPSAAS